MENRLNQKTALVVGGNGGIGTELLFQLHAKQYMITATYHNPQDKDTLVAGQALHLDLASVTQEELEKEVCKYSVVFFCAGSGGANVWQVDRDGAVKLAGAISSCLPEQRPYLVLVSSLGCDQPEKMPESLREYAQAKKEADDVLFELQKNGMRFTIVRPGTLTDEKATNRVLVQDTVNTFKSESFINKYSMDKLSVSREDVACVMMEAAETFGAHGASHVIEVIGAEGDHAQSIPDSLKALV